MLVGIVSFLPFASNLLGILASRDYCVSFFSMLLGGGWILTRSARRALLVR